MNWKIALGVFEEGKMVGMPNRDVGGIENNTVRNEL